MEKREIIERMKGNPFYNFSMEYIGFGEVDSTNEEIEKLRLIEKYNLQACITEKISLPESLLAMSIYRETYDILKKYQIKKKEIRVPNYSQCHFQFLLEKEDITFWGIEVFPINLLIKSGLVVPRDEDTINLCTTIGNMIPVNIDDYDLIVSAETIVERLNEIGKSISKVGFLLGKSESEVSRSFFFEEIGQGAIKDYSNKKISELIINRTKVIFEKIII